MAINRITSDIIEALSASKPKTQAYDTEAQVVRVEGNTAWVHIPGGVDETPVALTINASEGDTVRVRVAGGTAWIMGNDSAPPTDDKTAMVAIRNSMEAVNIAKETTVITEDLSQRIANANGLYETQQVTPGGATITYMHNKPLLAESDIQIMISDVGVMVTANGTDPTPTWYGLEVNGNLIANILSANGINADWINAGALVIYDNNNNEIFRADKTNKIFQWNMEHSQMEEDGDMTLRNTAEVNDNEDAESPAFTSKKNVIRHYSSGTPAVEVNNTTIKYGESIEFNSQYLQYVTEALYEQGQAATEKVYTGTMSPIDGIYYWDSYDQRTSHLNFNRGGDASGAYLQLQNRYIEPFWATTSQNAIVSGQNINSLTTPGTYVCPNGTIAATLSNAPFTNSGFQLCVYQWSSYDSAYERMQIAWQNNAASVIKYRIRTSSNAWGSWQTIARTSDLSSYALKSTPTFTLTDTTHFTLTRQYLQKSGRIACINMVLTAKTALSAETVYNIGDLSPIPASTVGIYGKSGSATPQNIYVYSRAANNLVINPATAIASGGVIEINGCYCTAS
jgi:hypothetical protein